VYSIQILRDCSPAPQVYKQPARVTTAVYANPQATYISRAFG